MAPYDIMCKQIEHQLEFGTQKNHALSPMNQLLLTLRFYATGTFQLVVGDTLSVHKSTVCRTLHRVTSAIAGLRADYIKFPMSQEDRQRVMSEFHRVSGLPGVIGAVDCTHVAIQSPGGDDAEIYRNRKGNFSVNVQLVCDPTGYISDVVARWPGSVHDSTIFDNCHLRALLETGPLNGYLVGDGGYPCRRYLLTPVNNPVNQAETAYNNAQIAARNCIERVNGMLKRRFPALKYGMRIRLDRVLPVIVATAVLHNIATVLGDEVPPVGDELHHFFATKRLIALPGDDSDDEAGATIQPAAGGAAGMRHAVINGHFA